jgi:hypothetical protein
MTALTVTVCGVTVRSKTSERAVQAEPKSVECTSLRTSAPRLDVAVRAEYSAAIDIRSDLAVSSSRLQLAGNASGAASMALPRCRPEVPIAPPRCLNVALPRCRCCLDAGAASMAPRGAYSADDRHACSRYPHDMGMLWGWLACLACLAKRSARVARARAREGRHATGVHLVEPDPVFALAYR